jgi:hypothetical protein
MKERNRETLEAYMIREMAAALKLRGGKPDLLQTFYQAAERDRDRLGHGPWTPYEPRIKQKWEQGRSYSADLAETLRQHDEQWEARERWRAERNRQRKAEDAEKPHGNSSARGRKVFLAEMAGWLLGWLAIFGFVYFAVWLGHAVRSSTLSYLMVLIGMFVLFRLNSGKWKFWSRSR